MCHIYNSVGLFHSRGEKRSRIDSYTISYCILRLLFTDFLPHVCYLLINNSRNGLAYKTWQHGNQQVILAQ